MAQLRNIPTDWRDLVRKAMPIDKRGATWLDWNYAAIAPQRALNAEFQLFAEGILFNNSVSVQEKAIKELLNDLYDPSLRGITITTDNDPTVFTNVNINIPDYLAYGNYEKIFRRALERYLYMGVQLSFNTYTYGGTAPEFVAYLDALEAGLGVGDVLQDREIWAVIYLWNQLYGSGLISDFKRLHLISPTNKANSLIDFMDPVSTALLEVPNGGAISHGVKGISSDGLAYINTQFIPSAEISSLNNYATVLIVSDENIDISAYDLGVINGTNFDWINLSNGTAFKAGSTDFVTFTDLGKGAYIHYNIGGSQDILKCDSVITTTRVNTGGALSTIPKYLCTTNAGGIAGTPKSLNVYSTYGEIDAAVSSTNRIFINRVLKEYNRRIGR